MKQISVRQKNEVQRPIVIYVDSRSKVIRHMKITEALVCQHSHYKKKFKV